MSNPGSGLIFFKAYGGSQVGINPAHYSDSVTSEEVVTRCSSSTGFAKTTEGTGLWLVRLHHCHRSDADKTAVFPTEESAKLFAAKLAIAWRGPLS